MERIWALVSSGEELTSSSAIAAEMCDSGCGAESVFAKQGR